MCHILQTTWTSTAIHPFPHPTQSLTDLCSNTSVPSPFPFHILILITLLIIPTILILIVLLVILTLLLPLVIIAAACCCPSSAHCHTPTASHMCPSSRCWHPPERCHSMPINELTGLILKWEALLQLKYSSDIPWMSGQTPHDGCSVFHYRTTHAQLGRVF